MFKFNRALFHEEGALERFTCARARCTPASCFVQPSRMPRRFLERSMLKHLNVHSLRFWTRGRHCLIALPWAKIVDISMFMLGTGSCFDYKDTFPCPHVRSCTMHPTTEFPIRSEQPFGRYARKCLNKHTHTHAHRHTHRLTNTFRPTCFGDVHRCHPGSDRIQNVLCYSISTFYSLRFWTRCRHCVIALHWAKIVC